MQNKIKVSIIVPVYNTSMYLEQCLNSLLCQSLEGIEIICVDDGSTDNSLQILQNFAQNDKRIRVLTQKNQGQSVARNLAMNVATGEYIGFIDSDDWIDEKMFEKLYQNAKKFDSNISMCSFTLFNEKTGLSSDSDPYFTLNLFPESFEDRSFSYKETYDFIFRICVQPCNKIYKRDFLTQIGAKFPEGLFFEDNVFFYETFMQSEKNCLIKEPLYTYRVGTGHSTVSGDEYKKLDFFEIFRLIEKFLKEKKLYDGLADYFVQYKKNTLQYWYKKLTDEKIKEIYSKKLAEEIANEAP